MDLRRNSIFENLLKTENYMENLYTIDKEIEYPHFTKIYGSTKDTELSIRITRTPFDMNTEEVVERISNLMDFIQSNVVLVENIWLDRIGDTNSKRILT